jgi:hypothetical protein
VGQPDTQRRGGRSMGAWVAALALVVISTALAAIAHRAIPHD